MSEWISKRTAAERLGAELARGFTRESSLRWLYRALIEEELEKGVSVAELLNHDHLAPLPDVRIVEYFHFAAIPPLAMIQGMVAAGWDYARIIVAFNNLPWNTRPFPTPVEGDPYNIAELSLTRSDAEVLYYLSSLGKVFWHIMQIVLEYGWSLSRIVDALRGEGIPLETIVCGLVTFQCDPEEVVNTLLEATAVAA